MAKFGTALVAAGSVLAAWSSAGAGSTNNAAVQKAVRQFNAAGSVPSGCGSTAAIIDEFAPFGWDSWADWTDAYSKYNSANAITDTKGTQLKFRHISLEGNRAYVVTTALYSYKQAGHARSERGAEVFVLEKGPSGWCPKSSAWFAKAGGVDGGADATAIGEAVTAFASMKPGLSVPPTAIADEFAPYAWQGDDASANWHAGLEKMIAQSHSSDADLVITPGQPVTLSVNGNKAYGVYPTVIHYKDNGKAVQERGMFAFMLAKSAGAWHIASWAWAKD